MTDSKKNKYNPPLKIKGKLDDVLKASFKGKPEKLEEKNKEGKKDK